MKRNVISVNTVFPVVLFILEAAWMKLTFDIPVSASDTTTALTSASYPRFVLLLMMVCTVGVFIGEVVIALRGKPVKTEEDDDEGKPTGAAANIQQSFEAAEAEKVGTAAAEPVKVDAEAEAKAHKMDVTKVVILIVALLVYALVMSKVGFIISTAVLMLLTGYLYGQKNKILLIGVSVLFPIALYVVFRFALQIYLPTLFI